MPAFSALDDTAEVPQKIPACIGLLPQFATATTLTHIRADDGQFSTRSIVLENASAVTQSPKMASVSSKETDQSSSWSLERL